MPASDRMLEILVVPARIELRHVIHVFGCDDLLDGYAAFPKSCNDIRGRLSLSPSSNDLVEYVVGGRAAIGGRQSVILEQPVLAIASTNCDQSWSSRTDSATHASSVSVG